MRTTRASRTEIEGRVAATRASLDRARSELTDARGKCIEAEKQWLDGGTKQQLARRRDASDEVERCEVLARRAEDAHDAAGVELAKLDREDRLREMERLRAELARFDDALATHAGAFLALDRQIDEGVLALGVAVSDALGLHRRIEQLADDARMPSGLGAAPSLDEAALAVRRVVTAARSAEGRDYVAPMVLASAPDAGDWRLRGMTAAEIAAIGTASAQAAEESRDIATLRLGADAAKIAEERARAAAEAAKNAPPPDASARAKLQREINKQIGG